MNKTNYYFDPHARGLAIFMGGTEALVMDLVWRNQPLTVKRTLALWPATPKPAYTTIMTILNRLVEKELLQRKKDGRHFVYSATLERETFLTQRIRTIHKCLSDNFPDKQKS